MHGSRRFGLHQQTCGYRPTSFVDESMAVPLSAKDRMKDEPDRGRVRDVEDLELKLLLEAIYERYDYDFRQYSRPHLKRQFLEFARQEKLPSLSSVQDLILHHPSRFKHLLRYLSISTTSLFRDPQFYRAFRERVVPILKTF